MLAEALGGSLASGRGGLTGLLKDQIQPQVGSKRADRFIHHVQWEYRTFDLVWPPKVFLPREVLERGLRSAWAALRPGGWILLIAYSTPGMELDAGLGCLMNFLWGGDPPYPEQVTELLAADFARTQVFPVLPGMTFKLIMGQRPAS